MLSDYYSICRVYFFPFGRVIFPFSPELIPFARFIIQYDGLSFCFFLDLIYFVYTLYYSVLHGLLFRFLEILFRLYGLLFRLHRLLFRLLGIFFFKYV